MAKLAHESDGVHPAEDFFDHLASTLADAEAGVSGGVLVDVRGTVAAVVLSDVGREVACADAVGEAALVVALG